MQAINVIFELKNKVVCGNGVQGLSSFGYWVRSRPNPDQIEICCRRPLRGVSLATVVGAEERLCDGQGAARSSLLKGLDVGRRGESLMKDRCCE